jgi:membrane-bound serine protease (ClpP class)
MTAVPDIVTILTNPNVAFVLFVGGLLGVAVELVHPNLASGIAGAFLLVLAFAGFGGLPVNVAGLLLVGLGVVLFVLEAQVISHGLLTLAGVVSLALGASILYATPAGQAASPPVAVAPVLIAVTTGTTALIFVLVTIAAIRTRRMKASAGTVGTTLPLGTHGIVRAPLDPVGTAQLGGEAWSARAADGRAVARDTLVHLVGFDGLTVLVEPDDHHLAATPPAPMPAGRT